MAVGTGVRVAEPGPPVQTVAALFAAFVAVWSVYFVIAESQASIRADMAEAYAWGREFQLGYNQHPPFWAWICGAWFMVFPRAGWAFAILSSLNAAIGLLGSWKLIGRFARCDERVAATALLLLTPFYTFLSYNFNANTIFLSIWPWTTYFFLRAIDEDGIVDAILFGVCMGLALLSKYYALILGATCFLAALQHPARARYFRSTSPYVSIAVTAALCAPHIGWLLSSGAPPVRYLAQISGVSFGVAAFYAAAAFFGALTQNAVVFGLVALTAALAPRSVAVPVPARAPRFRLLATLALAPLLLTVLAGVTLRTQVTNRMTIGTFSLMPLLAIEIGGSRGLERLRWLSVRLGGGFSLVALAASPAVSLGKAWFSHNTDDTAPRKELAEAATRFWQETTDRPLAYVGGSLRYDDAVAFYSRERPHVFVRFDYFANQWVTPGALAEKGLLSVCVRTDAKCLAATAGLATPLSTHTEMTLSHRFWGHEAKPVDFIVTVIPPGAS
jgi:4-amino-4-deoxy-L-arabinose transferase-like glycosyltransferase